MATFFTEQDIIEIDVKQVDRLKRAAAAAPSKRARLCLHHHHNDAVQEMVIAFQRGSYNRPHRHQDKVESFHVIEGELIVVFFEETGQVTRRVQMGLPGSGRAFLYRLSASLWHTVVLLSESVVIHETTTGPFVPGDAEFAPWAPDGGDASAVSAFLAGILTA